MDKGMSNTAQDRSGQMHQEIAFFSVTVWEESRSYLPPGMGFPKGPIEDGGRPRNRISSSYSVFSPNVFFGLIKKAMIFNSQKFVRGLL
jgi:hypothetical protein